MDPTEDFEYKKRLLDYRNLCQTTAQKSQALYDKILLTLSSSTLGITFVFIKDIVNEKPLDAFFVLPVGWMLVCGSMGVSLWAHFVSVKANEKAVEEADAELVDDIVKTKRLGAERMRISKKVKNSNKWSGILFCSGVLVLFLYLTITIGLSK